MIKRNEFFEAGIAKISAGSLTKVFERLGFRRKRKWNKVFEVGVAKTGTNSLAKAYKILGLRKTGWNQVLYDEVKAGKFENALAFAEKFEAFRDGPWHEEDLYERLDKRFPNSKFILLERDDKSWIKSVENFFSPDKNWKKIPEKYLIKNFSEKVPELLNFKHQRYRKVKRYFMDRPDDLLVMNICAGEGWEKLCPFLGLPISKVKFPYEFKTPTS
jgi:hypothetical protein